MKYLRMNIKSVNTKFHKKKTENKNQVISADGKPLQITTLEAEENRNKPLNLNDY